MVNTIAAGQLKAYVESVEFLEQQKAEIAATIKEVFDTAKSEGFDTKIMRQIIKLRAMPEADRAEQKSLLELYMQALEMAENKGDAQ